MIRITYNDLSFERKDEAEFVVGKYDLILFKDIDDVIICYYSTADVIEALRRDLLAEMALYFQANL